MKKILYSTQCSKCNQEFQRKPNESITCPQCRDKANKPYIPEEDFRHQFSHWVKQ